MDRNTSPPVGHVFLTVVLAPGFHVPPGMLTRIGAHGRLRSHNNLIKTRSQSGDLKVMRRRAKRAPKSKPEYVPDSQVRPLVAKRMQAKRCVFRRERRRSSRNAARRLAPRALQPAPLHRGRRPTTRAAQDASQRGAGAGSRAAHRRMPTSQPGPSRS